ncbi:MAG: BamA/TamA family outer membrane protein [Mangrovibacterium sp.]
MACSQTRYVPKDKFLIDKVNVNIDNKSVDKDKIYGQINQKENLRILGLFKFHLGMYNLSRKKKENGWLKRIGEAPSIYDEYQTKRSIDNLYIFLDNKGYYDATITDTTIFNLKKRKVEVDFNIKTGSPYRIRNYEHQIADKKIEPVIFNGKDKELVHKGDIFDIDVLNKERNRISTLMKNNGYYAFTPEHIVFKADSNLAGRWVDLSLIITDNDLQQKVDSIVPHKKYTVQSYTYNTNFAPSISNFRHNPKQKPDTSSIDNYNFIYHKKLHYKPNLLINTNHIIDSVYYCLNNVSKTLRFLNSVQQFKIADINFTEDKQSKLDSIGRLDCVINLSPMNRQGFSIELEGTNSSGNLGLAGNFNYKHRNLFKGGEMLNLNLRIAGERQQTLISNELTDFNTKEYGIEASVSVPKLLSPFRFSKMYAYSVPQTIFTAGYNFQNRPDYTRDITTFQFGYQWKSRESRTNTLNILDLNLVNMQKYNEDFINSIQDLYIKSSYTDHFIMAMNFSSVNKPKRTDAHSYHYLRWSIESAGNILSAIANLSHKWNKYTDVDSETGEAEQYYRINNIRFAQYLKGDVDFRYGYKIDKYNSIVTRGFIGVVLPYGNFDVTPFEKRYFSGGANSIRAWQVRTLGPGSYTAGANEYPNQSADIKLEANLEYRFKMIKFMEGAFFFDAGNIWAINDKDNRDGAQFKINEFYKQIALGTGVGIRFDFTYFLFRLDLGMKLVDPSLPEGNRFIIGNYPITKDCFNLNFAIGYPF